MYIDYVLKINYQKKRGHGDLFGAYCDYSLSLMLCSSKNSLLSSKNFFIFSGLFTLIYSKKRLATSFFSFSPNVDVSLNLSNRFLYSI